MWDLGEQRLIKSHPSNRIYIFSTLKQIFYVCVFWLLNSIACRHQPRQQRNGKLIITLLEGLNLKTRDYNNSKWDIKGMPFCLLFSLNSGQRDAVKGVLLCLHTLQPSQYIEGIIFLFCIFRWYYCRFLFVQINRIKPDRVNSGGKEVLLGHANERSFPAQSCCEQCLCDACATWVSQGSYLCSITGPQVTACILPPPPTKKYCAFWAVAGHLGYSVCMALEKKCSLLLPWASYFPHWSLWTCYPAALYHFFFHNPQPQYLRYLKLFPTDLIF